VVEPLESEETLVTKMRLAWRKGRNWLRYTRTREPSDTHTTTTTSRRLKGENHGAAINFYLKPKNQKKLFCICLLSQNCSYRPFFLCAYLLEKQTNNINWRDSKTLSDMFYRLCIMLSVFPLKNPSPALVKEMALIRRWDRLIVEPLPLHDYMNE
jgi:hypothetical protein